VEWFSIKLCWIIIAVIRIGADHKAFKPLKSITLYLIFLKYISDAFTEVYEKLKKEKDSEPEDVEENVFDTLKNYNHKHQLQKQK